MRSCKTYLVRWQTGQVNSCLLSFGHDLLKKKRVKISQPEPKAGQPVLTRREGKVYTRAAVARPPRQARIQISELRQTMTYLKKVEQWSPFTKI